MITLIENQTIAGTWSCSECVPPSVDAAKLCDTGDADVVPGERVSLYTQSWQRKTPAQLAAESLDENGEKLPTAAELKAKADKEAKIAALKARIEKLKNWAAYHQDFEERELVPIAEKLATSAYKADQSLLKQREAFAAAKAAALAKLRTANAKSVQLAAANATKYKALLQSAEKELQKLES